MNQSTGIDETGTLVWQLVVALFVTYFIVYLMLVKGVAVCFIYQNKAFKFYKNKIKLIFKVFGKLVYFIATFPYLVLLILGIRAWMLPGASEGIKFYVIPDWSRLADINVWKDAASNILILVKIHVY